MAQQPEALRLADTLDAHQCDFSYPFEAAAELRRLHEVNQELLEALKLALPVLDGHWLMKAHAAIAKHGGAA